MAKILKKIGKAEDDVKRWAAAEYKYLEDFKNDLEELKRHLNDLKSENRTLGKAKVALRMVGRAERRVSRYYQRMDRDVKELYKILPENLREEEVDIEEQIKIAAKSILEKGSRYVGSLRSELNALIIQFDLLKNYRNKQEITEKINAIINNLIGQTDKMIEWIRGLVSAVKEEETFARRLSA